MNTENKCIVYGCLNTKGGGLFVGDLCSPCHSTLAHAPSPCHSYSQAWRNMRKMAAMCQEKQDALQKAVKEIERLEDMSNLPAWYIVKESLKCQ